jgi:hypothetical protein
MGGNARSLQALIPAKAGWYSGKRKAARFTPGGFFHARG